MSWGISNKKTEGRPHGVSLPWVSKSLILSSYGREFGAGSLGTKSNIAKTSCGFVRLDSKFEKPKAERECLLLGVSSAWGVIEKPLLSTTWKKGSGAINYKFLFRSRVLHSYHIHTLLGKSKSNRPRDYEILPSSKTQRNRVYGVCLWDLQKSKVDRDMGFGAGRDFPTVYKNQTRHAYVRSSAELGEIKSG
jgi:hypothetical protein